MADDRLRKLVLHLLDRIMELEVKVEALYLAVEEVGVSRDSIQQKCDGARKAKLSEIRDAKKIAFDKEVRKVLEKFEGPEQ